MLAVARLAGKVGGLTEVFFTGLCGALPAPKGRAAIFLLAAVMFAVLGCGGSKKAARKMSDIQLLDSIILLDSRAYPIVTKDFEMFDFETYGKRIQTIRLPDGIVIDINVSEGAHDDPYSGIFFKTYYPDSYFSLFRQFRLDGTLICKGLIYAADFDKGVWYYFDEHGTLVEEVDYDEQFRFTFEDILIFCAKNNIRVEKGFSSQDRRANWTTRRMATEIRRECSWRRCTWEIISKKTIQPDDFGEIIEETIVLNGKTGRVIRKRQRTYSFR